MFRSFNLSFLLILFLSSASLSAVDSLDKIEVDFDRPNFQTLLSPKPDGNFFSKRFRPLEWLEVEFPFKVKSVAKLRGHYLSSLTFRYYVIVEDFVSREYRLLTKEVKHINIPIGDEIYSSFYLSPASLRGLGSKNANRDVLKGIGVEAYFQGNLIGKWSQPKGDWWKDEDLKQGKNHFLRNKSQTPFKFLWWDRYAEIKDR